MTDEPRLRFAIAIPQHVPSGAFDPSAFRDVMGRAEALGFESAWTQEQVLGDMPSLGPLETMAYAAACSERIRLGCAVLVSTLHSPLHLAKSIATLDQLSRGRIEVGVGSGGRYRAFAAFGVDPATFVSRFTEGLALMKACWTESRVDFDGRFWQVSQSAMEPKPFQSPMSRVSVKITPKVRWNAGWQFYNYHEDFGLFGSYQNYHAHTGYTSILWAF